MRIAFKYWLLLIVLYFLTASSIYALASLIKHSHYETFGDLAVFNQGIWQYSRLQWPVITLHLNRPFLGDHFHPMLITLAPFYWIYPSEKMLLFLQPFIILSAIIPLFLIGLRLTKSIFFTISIIIAYSLYIPLQYTIFYDFHEIVFLPPLFAWVYYFFLQNKRHLVSLFLILLLLVKEEIGFFVATFGLYLLIFHKNWRKFGIFWFGLGIIYSLMLMYFVIPKIGGSYIYFDYGQAGNTPLNVLFNFLKDPIHFAKLFFVTIKLETLYKTFYPFAFLPLFSSLGFLLSSEQFFSRFLDLRNTTRWTIGYHYSAPMIIITSLASLIFAGKFIKKPKLLIILGIIILLLTRLEQINTSAIFLIKRPQFWQRAIWMDNIDQAISLIPSDVSVAAQNNLISHLSNRKKIYTLDNREKAEYILVDLHQGQSDYNFSGSDKRQEIVGGIKNEKKFVFQKGDVYLIKK